MANLFGMKGGKMLSILGKVAERMTPELGEAIDADPKLVDVMTEALMLHLDYSRNPFEMSVVQTLDACRRVNEAEAGCNPYWEKIPEKIFTRLATSAPPWPRGRHMYRSLRIRFGEGDEGVAKTFEAHAARIR
ncbi:MAG: hypothetical protein WCV84_06020, partial [Patescibacteria group bacterium]